MGEDNSDVSKDNREQRELNKVFLRDCEAYKQEYKDCNSLKGRFNQYFVYGETREAECKQWQQDYKNCVAWKKTNDPEALEKVAQSEQARQQARVRGMMANNVWQLRKDPVSSEVWNRPLPEYLAKVQNSSYLTPDPQNKNIQDGDTKQKCTIL